MYRSTGRHEIMAIARRDLTNFTNRDSRIADRVAHGWTFDVDDHFHRGVCHVKVAPDGQYDPTLPLPIERDSIDHVGAIVAALAFDLWERVYHLVVAVHMCVMILPVKTEELLPYMCEFEKLTSAMREAPHENV